MRGLDCRDPWGILLLVPESWNYPGVCYTRKRSFHYSQSTSGEANTNRSSGMENAWLARLRVLQHGDNENVIRVA